MNCTLITYKIEFLADFYYFISLSSNNDREAGFADHLKMNRNKF